jgi:hypothetical protein
MHWVSTTIFKIIGDSYSLSCDSIYTQRIECSLNSRPLLLDISHLYNTYARQVKPNKVDELAPNFYRPKGAGSRCVVFEQAAAGPWLHEIVESGRFQSLMEGS